MPYGNEELKVNIIGDASKLKGALNEADIATAKFADKIGSIGRTMTVVGAAITAVSIGLIKMASDAEETGTKFDVVFKDVSDEAAKTAKNLTDNFGLSTKAAKQLLSDTGDLLTGFGFTGEAALDLSTKVNELAVDLASFTNYSGGAEGASAALTKALLGERESVKSLGISILETDVQAKVLEMTQKGMTFETDRQAKAYATLTIAQEQSKNAIGDFARTSEGFANQWRILRARVEDVVVALGEKLLPMATKLVGKVIEVVTHINEWIDAHPKLVEWVVKVGAVVGGLALVGGPILMAAAAFMKAKTAIDAVAVSLKLLTAGPVGWVVIGIGAIIIATYSLLQAWEENWAGIHDYTDKVMAKLKPSLDWLTDKIDKVITFARMLGLEWGILVASISGGGGAIGAFADELGTMANLTDQFKEKLGGTIEELKKIADLEVIFRPAEEAIKKIVDSMTPYEKQLEAINNRYDEAAEKLKVIITNKDELKAAIDRLNEGRSAEITLLDRQEIACEKVAKAKKKLVDLTKSLTDKIYEFTHTDEEVKLKTINAEYDLLIENAKEVFTNYNDLRLAVEAINEARQKEIDNIGGVVDKNKELVEANKEVAESSKEAEVAADTAAKTGRESWEGFTIVIKKATASLSNFTNEGVAAAIATIKMKFLPAILDIQEVMSKVGKSFLKGEIGAVNYNALEIFYKRQISNLKAMMNEQVDVVKYGLGVYNEELGKLGVDTNEMPSYAVGTPYVPETGLAVVHQGEEINPPGQRSYDQNSGSFSPTININNPVVRNDNDISNIRNMIENVLNNYSKQQFNRQGNELLLGV